MVAYVITARTGHVMDCYDAASHLAIARRVLDATTPGFAQLGNVWLPLPHLLSLPLVCVDAFHHDGFAGAVASMVAYVIGTVLLHRTTQSLTGSTLAGVVAAVFALTPNVLYTQSTPMTVVVAVVAWQRRGWSYLEGTLLGFLHVAGAGVGAWLLWNLLIFGNPLCFQQGEYAKPSLWVSSGELSISHPWVATQVYAIGTADNLWLSVAALALVGLVALLVRERLSSASLPVLALLVMFPFFVSALAGGQRPMRVPSIGGSTCTIYERRQA